MHITLTALFSGTGHEKENDSTLVAALKAHINTSETQHVMAFDGCGITYGLMGVVFGTGIDKQCKEVIDSVESLIKDGHTVTLNAYGHSRGAIAAMMLAKQLGKISPECLTINLALMDPVPGNFITTSTVDVANISLANKVENLTDCINLTSVMALYPYEPLPSLACHAPLFGRYPLKTMVDESVVPGCHSGAQYVQLHENKIDINLQTSITCIKTIQFLQRCGTEFNPIILTQWMPPNTIRYNFSDSNAINRLLTEQYEKNLKELNINARPIIRHTHSANGYIIRASHKKNYFNLEHQYLMGMPANPDDVAATIQKKYGPISIGKRFMLNHPHLTMAIKWSGIALGLSAAFMAVGAGLLMTGLSVTMPVLLLSTAIILASSILLTAAMMGFWYKAAKPVGQWGINRFFYPDYAEKEESTMRSPLTYGDV